MVFFGSRPASSHGRPASSHGAKSGNGRLQASNARKNVVQIVPLGEEQFHDCLEELPHWKKLPKKYEQLKKKAADVKRRRKAAERKGWFS